MVSAAEPPWHEADPIGQADYRSIRREMMFDHFKWDPQMQDVATLGRTPLVLRRGAWHTLRRHAEALYSETLAIERTLLDRPAMLGRLGLPRRVRRLLQRSRAGSASVSGPRMMRFDFHHTPEGWRVTEVNSDVPGGQIEAGAYTALVAGRVVGAVPTGDPVSVLIDSLPPYIEPPGQIALVYATAYSDDAQVMFYLARELDAAGYEVTHCGPDHPACWVAGLAMRFYPAEWLANLPRDSAWSRFFVDGPVPMTNPGTALITQSKRWPLVMDRLGVDAPAWRALMPPTRGAERRRLGEAGWVFKPALGRVGGGIGMTGCTSADDWRKIRRAVRFNPRNWVMQARFEQTPWQTSEGPRFPCVGVYVIDGKAAGVYGRASGHGLVDHSAVDLAVLVEAPSADRPILKEEVRPCASMW
ncbi:MAG: glutathionylspermidine synthase family protein [Planctomycetota bacterium]